MQPQPIASFPEINTESITVVGDSCWWCDPETQILSALDLGTRARTGNIETGHGLWYSVGATAITLGRTLEVVDHGGKRVRKLVHKSKHDDPSLDGIDDTGTFALGNSDGALLVFDLRSGKLVHRQSLGEDLGSTKIAPTGTMIAIALADKPTVLIDTKTFARREVAGSEMPYPTNVTWSPDGQRLVIYSNSKAVAIDPVAGCVIGAPVELDSESWSASFVGNTARVLFGGDRLSVWEVPSNRVRVVSVEARHVAVTYDGERVVTTSAMGPGLLVYRTSDLLAVTPAKRIPKKPAKRVAKTTGAGPRNA